MMEAVRWNFVVHKTPWDPKLIWKDANYMLKVLARTSSEAGAQARPCVADLNKVFWNQFGILGLWATWITAVFDDFHFLGETVL